MTQQLLQLLSLNGTRHDADTFKRFSSHLFNYNVFTAKGTNAFGGVLIAVHKSIQCRRLDEFIHLDNLIVLEFDSSPNVFQLVTCYSPPTEQIPLESFDRILHMNPNTIFAGDFNAKHKSWSNSMENQKGSSLFNWLSSSIVHSSLDIINKYTATSTRSNATIDLIIAPTHMASSSFSVLKSIGSDHYPVLWQSSLKIHSTHHKFLIKRTYRKAHELFMTWVGSYWQDLGEQMVYSITFFSLYERFLSLSLSRFTIISYRQSIRPSLPYNIVNMIGQKRIYLKAFRQSRHPFFSIMLREISKKIQKMLFQYKRQS